MEKENEVSGLGNSNTSEFRQPDTRLGRWFSSDSMEKAYNFTFSRFWKVSMNDFRFGLFLLLIVLVFSGGNPSWRMILLVGIFFILPFVFIIDYFITAFGVSVLVQNGGKKLVYHNKVKRKTIEFTQKDVKACICYSNTNDFQYFISSKYFYYRVVLKSGEEIILNSFVVDDLKDIFWGVEYKSLSFPLIF